MMDKVHFTKHQRVSPIRRGTGESAGVFVEPVLSFSRYPVCQAGKRPVRAGTQQLAVFDKEVIVQNHTGF